MLEGRRAPPVTALQPALAAKQVQVAADGHGADVQLRGKLLHGGVALFLDDGDDVLQAHILHGCKFSFLKRGKTGNERAWSRSKQDAPSIGPKDADVNQF